MIKAIVLLALVGVAIAGPGEMKKMLKKKINKWNWDSKCWGKENLLNQMAGEKAAMDQCSGQTGVATTLPSSVYPVRRLMQAYPGVFASQPMQTNQFASYQPWGQVHHLGKRSIDQGKLIEMAEDVQDFKETWHNAISNLTCVLSKMGYLTTSGDINVSMFQTQFWNKINIGATLAGSDPEWRNMLVTRWTDCYDISQAMPASALLRMMPMMEDKNVQTCRNMVFFKCAMKVKTECCAAAQLHDMLTSFHGPINVDWTQIGLPADKYEMSAMGAMVHMASASPVEKFVHGFFRSDGSDL